MFTHYKHQDIIAKLFKFNFFFDVIRMNLLSKLILSYGYNIIPKRKH